MERFRNIPPRGFCHLPDPRSGSQKMPITAKKSSQRLKIQHHQKRFKPGVGILFTITVRMNFALSLANGNSFYPSYTII